MGRNQESVDLTDIYRGDAEEILRTMPDGSFDCCVTSPPYWGLRDYGCDGQIGLESSPDEYVSRIVRVFQEVRRVLRDDGTLWLNLGDCYATGVGKVGACPGGGEQCEKWKAGYRGNHKDDPKRSRVAAQMGTMTQPNRMPQDGLKPKDLVGIPWMVAFALRADGWYLRSDIIWAKRNCLPESVTDRPTKSHEYIFLLAKSRRYYYNADAIREPQECSDKRAGRNSSCLTDKSTRPRKGLRSQDPERFGLTRGMANQPCTHEGGKNKRDVWMDGNPITSGKWSAEDAQSSGRRIVENVKIARANGGDHDSPFGDSRNKRDVWHVATHPFPDAHFATFPPALVVPCVLAGCRPGGVVLDPFAGSGTVGVVALQNGRRFAGIDVNEKYVEMIRKRLGNIQMGLELND